MNVPMRNLVLSVDRHCQSFNRGHVERVKLGEVSVCILNMSHAH